jgi:hypothetical protein
LKRSGKVQTSVDDDDEEGSFGARCRNLIESCEDVSFQASTGSFLDPTVVNVNLRERLLGKFIFLNTRKRTGVNGNTLPAAISFNLPYFIPEHLGGLGLPSVGIYRPSDSDLRFARKMYDHPHLYPLPKNPISVSWQTWKYASKRFPSLPYAINTDFESGSMYSRKDVCGLACVEAMFRLETLEDLYKEVIGDSNSVFKYQMQLMKLWRKVRLSGLPPEPFDENNYPKIFNNDDRPVYLKEVPRQDDIVVDRKCYGKSFSFTS